MDSLIEIIIARFNYWVYIIIMMIGLNAMIAKNNLIKKLIGMSIFQTAIILFFVSVGVKSDSTIPILSHAQVHAAAHHDEEKDHESTGGDEKGDPPEHTAAEIDPDKFANPLPHVLMLTAIVVGVATLGVGLAVTQKIYGQYGTLEEKEILARIEADTDG